MELTGIHHLTAISARIRENHHFFTSTLGMRLVKRSANAWVERLRELGIPNSGLVDRHYFHSLDFREPNGILFEIASDVPGFTVDEDEATLGEKVALPRVPRAAEG